MRKSYYKYRYIYPPLRKNTWKDKFFLNVENRYIIVYFE